MGTLTFVNSWMIASAIGISNTVADSMIAKCPEIQNKIKAIKREYLAENIFY